MSILESFAKYFSLMLAGVVAVEQNIKNAPGSSKKAIVLSSIQAAAQIAGTADEVHVAQIGALIDGVVGALNASGVFTSKAVPAA